MKRALYISSITIGVLLITFLSLRIIWSFQSSTKFNVFILSKSVAHPRHPEHKAFVWLLNNNRYTPPNSSKYSYSKDYYGFFPIDIKNDIFDLRSIRINEIDAFASVFDMAYYADCYGVYSFEWYKGRSKPIRSQKVYGGLNQNDYLFMMKMLDLDKLVIAEYNMFSSPTNALVRSKTESLLGIGWSGWSGKYYPTLDTNDPAGPPVWMKNLYESQHLGVWPSDSHGIVLLNNDGILEVLTVGQELNTGIPIINVKPETAQSFGTATEVPFLGWFEFIDAKDQEVHAYYSLNATDRGNQILEKHRLSTIFPAVIQGKTERYYYFCGDFAHNPVRMWASKLTFGKQINSFLFKFRSPERVEFFTKFYTPLMEGIIEEYISESSL